MKQNIFQNLILGGVIALSGAVLPAHAADRLFVNVPFSFMVGNTKMAAGDYNVVTSQSGVVTLMGIKTSAMVLTVPGETKSPATALNFTAVGESPVLTTVELGSVTREIPLHAGQRKVTLVTQR